MVASPGWRLSLALAFGLLFCGNCIILGGLAGLVHACHDVPDVGTGFAGVADNKAEWLVLHQQSNINPNSSCSYTYGYYWWIFCLNVTVWFVALVELTQPGTFRVGAAALAAVAAMADQENSNRFLTLSRKLSAAGFGHGSVPSARSATAGFIISAVAAYWLILTLGCDAAVEDDDCGRVSPATTKPGKDYGGTGGLPVGTETATPGSGGATTV